MTTTDPYRRFLRVRLFLLPAYSCWLSMIWWMEVYWPFVALLLLTLVAGVLLGRYL